MSLYTSMVFVHVSAAVCLFIGMGIWFFGITAIARASRVEQVRTLADLMVMVRLVVPGSAVLVITAGLTMTQIAWRIQTGWIAVALASLVIIGPIGTWVIDPKVRRIAALAHTLPDGPLPATLAARTHDLVLRLGIQTLTAMLFGIIFLMTTKPALTTAIGAMVFAALLGVASGILLMRLRQSSQPERGKQQEEHSA
jgi:Predicted integral membrane protein (DUF2269)